MTLPKWELGYKNITRQKCLWKPVFKKYLYLVLTYACLYAGSHADDPVIYVTNGKLGLFEYEKEIPIAAAIVSHNICNT